MLVGALREVSLGPRSKVLDLCAGSGLLALTAAAAGAGKVVAVDVSRGAMLSTWLNARLNGLSVEARRGDLFSPVDGERFDLIVSNPPYLPGPAEELPRQGRSRAWEAGPQGRAVVDRICAEAACHLAPGGVLLLVHSSVCGERVTVEALRSRGLLTHVVDRRRGPLGPRLRARAGWLREHGLLLAGDCEELLIFRAQRPAVALSSPP